MEENQINVGIGPSPIQLSEQPQPYGQLSDCEPSLGGKWEIFSVSDISKLRPGACVLMDRRRRTALILDTQ